MKAKTVYICTECGGQSAKWLGKCPTCGAWNSMEEQVISDEKKTSKTSVPSYFGQSSPAVPIDELIVPEYMRLDTGYGEVDRVLGGGLVCGSVVLLSGEPGIGKSTLLMQIAGKLSSAGGKKILYVSGEESTGQLKMRAKRLGVSGRELYIQTETNIDTVMSEIQKVAPDIVIADSVQTVYSDDSTSLPGSVTQVKEAALRFISLAKTEGISVILVGHVNKEGAIAGPKVLEHMVDAVLHFEGDRDGNYRIIRAVKNRFGPTNEIGVFEMTGEGLKEVGNPSEVLLAGRPKNVSGNCAVGVMEGSRPIIAEIQALVTPTAFSAPRRTSNGFDYNRLYLLLAVLEKRMGLRFSTYDTYMNVIGGLRLDDPAADLPAVLSLISCIKDKPLPDDIIAAGEVGLSGECRAVTNAEQRVREAERLGFSKFLIPAKNVGDGKLDQKGFSIRIVPVRGIYDAIAEAVR